MVDAYGPEAFAVAEMPLNAGIGGITRRFMNCLGAVNYTAPVQLCMGNTAQVHRAVYGWFAFSNWDQTDCIVYFGQDRNSERWPSEYLELKAALARGAKLIEIDPRETETDVYKRQRPTRRVGLPRSARRSAGRDRLAQARRPGRSCAKTCRLP